jgi:hypothetical protein
MTENRDDYTRNQADSENRNVEPVSRIGSIRGVFWRFLRYTIFQPDFGLGAVVGIGVGFWAYYKHSVQLLEGVVLTTDIGASVGLLAVTLAAMTLILGFLQGFYKDLIRSVRGGVKSFFYPFEAIAVVSGAAAISGVLSSLDADSSPFRVSSILFGLSVGLLTWAIIGAVQLVFMFVRHGEYWLDIDDALTPDIPDDGEETDPSAEAPDPQAGTHELAEQEQATDRYTKAIEQLGSDKLDVRIGGIYALERVARDSARDHPTVMDVLAAFVREHSREPWPPPDHPASQEPSTRPDVQAAVTVIGRRTHGRDIQPVDLSGARLVRANLAHAHLARADLTGADLTQADLTDANLIEAHLSDANLTGTDLSGAYLMSATLSRAVLIRATLTRATLTDADLTDADLTDAVLNGATLTGAMWPSGAAVPEGWQRDAGSGRLVATQGQ